MVESMPSRNDRKQRNVILGQQVDTIIEEQARREGITFTQVIQRAVLTREEILRMAATPNRLARITDPDLVAPPGVEVVRLAGGW